jgi:hypothetical protein
VIPQEITPEESGRPEKDHFSTLLDQKITEWIDQTLRGCTGYLIDLVNKCPSFDEDVKNQVIKAGRQFTTTYKEVIEDLHKTIVMNFSSAKMGTHILHTMLRQYLNYYQQFLELIESYYRDRRDRSSLGDIVDIQHLILEIRRYKSTF